MKHELDSEIEWLVSALARAQVSVEHITDTSANDPRLNVLSRDSTCLYHQVAAANFILLRVRRDWQTFKQLETQQIKDRRRL